MIKRSPSPWISLLAVSLFTQCNTPEQKPTTVAPKPATQEIKKEEPQPAAPSYQVTYHALRMKDSGRAYLKQLPAATRTLVYALNRIDAQNVRRADTLIVPDTTLPDFNAYSPFPMELPFLSQVNKIVYFSYPVQAFAAYEHGKLVRWGPTSMGKKATPTPTGLFFSNWKSEETVSTVKDEWILKWNFNIANKDGVGWHQYALPGYPASHSCLRLLEEDAKFLYGWADQWILKGANDLLAQGTPTIVFGSYPFGTRRPWLGLLNDPKANTITVETLQQQTDSFLPRIMEKQQQRETVSAERIAANGK